MYSSSQNAALLGSFLGFFQQLLAGLFGFGFGGGGSFFFFPLALQ